MNNVLMGNIMPYNFTLVNIFFKNDSLTSYSKKENLGTKLPHKKFSTWGEGLNYVVPETIPDVFQQTSVCSEFFLSSSLPELFMLFCRK